MKVQIEEKKTVEVKFLAVAAKPRYWEDSDVNGMEDINGTLIPCREGDLWKPLIDIEKGKITNWVSGVTASIHYKVCDQGEYKLIDEKGNCVLVYGPYAPDVLATNGEGFGDYLIMKIDEEGYIKNWNAKIQQMIDED